MTNAVRDDELQHLIFTSNASCQIETRRLDSLSTDTPPPLRLMKMNRKREKQRNQIATPPQQTSVVLRCSGNLRFGTRLLRTPGDRFINVVLIEDLHATQGRPIRLRRMLFFEDLRTVSNFNI